MRKNNAVGWLAGCAGLILSVGMARAQTGAEETASEEPICKDSGVIVSFPTASTTLDKNARGGLTGLATWMKAKDERTVKLQGYADPTGNAEFRARFAAGAAAQRATIAAALRRAGAGHLQLRTDRDWLMDVVRFVADRRRAGSGGASR